MADKKEFKNDFSWSFSRDNAFNTCKRKYYYSYYGSWGGWNKDADELSKKFSFSITQNSLFSREASNPPNPDKENYVAEKVLKEKEKLVYNFT